MTSEEIASATGAKAGFSKTQISGVATDSRERLNGKLFVALKGERFDAHDFVAVAIENGASAVLVHEERPEYKALEAKAAFFYVRDTLRALQDLAHSWRRKHGFKVIGISGSNGKTSSKEFTFQILKNFKKTVASQGSFNNHWGVPITILSASPETEILVLEMGMNHLGELTRLAEIAEPDITVITMVGQSHIGELGSQANVVKAKEELYLSAPKSAAIFNLDNQWTSDMYERAKKRATHSKLLTFSSHNDKCDVGLRAERMTVDGLEIVGHVGSAHGRCRVPVFGRHNVNNLMVAASVAWTAGMAPEQIWKTLPSVTANAWGRNQWLKLPSGASVLFDAYNANPESMSALLKNLYELDSSGRKFLILGEMLELGNESERAHRELGDLAGKIGAEWIWFIGPHYKAFEAGLKSSGFAQPAYFSSDFDPDISQKLKNLLGAGDVIALKASRGQKLEAILENWGLET